MKELPHEQITIGDTGRHRTAYNANDIIIDSVAEKVLQLEEGVENTEGRGTWKMAQIGKLDAKLFFTICMPFVLVCFFLSERT